MKRFFALLLASHILSVLGYALNRNLTKDAQKEALSNDNARIKALESFDVQTMSKIYADDYTLVTAEGGIRMNYEQISNQALKNFVSQKRSFMGWSRKSGEKPPFFSSIFSFQFHLEFQRTFVA